MNQKFDSEPPDRGSGAEREAKGFLERYYGPNAKLLISAVLVFGCVIIYAQSYRFGFVNFDDNVYIYKNPFIVGGLSFSTVNWAFQTFHAANWHPVTWLSHLLDVSLFGMQPGGPHIVNAVIHTINSLLVFFVTRSLTRATWKSAIVAMIFAFHPAHVESVAWISERKDLLSSLFFLLSLGFYVKYVRTPGKWSYFAVVACFAVGLMAKPMLVTLPFVLLLLDVWPLGRLKETVSARTVLPLITEKVPLFILSAASCVVTVIAQKQGGAVVPFEQLGLALRAKNACLAVGSYLWTFFVPIDLAAWYPYPETFSWLSVGGVAIVLLAVTAFAVIEARRRTYLIIGWLWFLGMLVPVIGLIQVGGQAHADRYTYLPYIGLSITVVWLCGELAQRSKINYDLVTAGVAILVIAGIVLSFRQAATWRDNDSFYAHTLAATDRQFVFEQGFCNYLLQNDRVDDAEAHCRRSIAIKPDQVNAYITLGIIEMHRKNGPAGLENFRKAKDNAPDDIQVLSNYVNGLIANGRLLDAGVEIEKIAALDRPALERSNYVFPLLRLEGVAFAQAGRPDLAINYFKAASILSDTDPELLVAMGNAFLAVGKPGDAVTAFKNARANGTETVPVLTGLGAALAASGNERDAREAFAAALKIDPDNKDVKDRINTLGKHN